MPDLTKPDTRILTPETLAEIEARANAATEGPWAAYHRVSPRGAHKHWHIGNEDGLCQITMSGHEHDYQFMAHARTDIPALCQTVRVAWAENERLNRLIAEATVAAPWRAGYTDYVPTAGDPVRSIADLIAHVRERGGRVSELESSVTFWQAEALMGHFCSEHAKNTRQVGHYCTICAKPFTMSVPQGEHPPKYKDLVTRNADLRTQLAQVTQERDGAREYVAHLLICSGSPEDCDACAEVKRSINA